MSWCQGVEPKLSQDGAFRSSRGKWHSWAQGWARSMITHNMAFYGARGQEKIERPTRLFLSGFARKAGDNREGQNMRQGNSTLVSCRIRQPVEKCHFFPLCQELATACVKMNLIWRVGILKLLHMNVAAKTYRMACSLPSIIALLCYSSRPFSPPVQLLAKPPVTRHG